MNSKNLNSEPIYTGRFAPSPTGPLHFGSLIAAVASYLDAKANQGLWLVRMEDLDPPREAEGAAEIILDQLQALDLSWDGDVLYQSSRLTQYQESLKELMNRELCFYCDCTRPRIKSLGSVYDGHCRAITCPPEGEHAIRVLTEDRVIAFEDLVQGDYQQNIQSEIGDFVILRKDKLFAYQLAVVVDDAFQGITHIIRGFDLIDSTPRQIYLQQLLGLATPIYGHIPVIVNEQGQKLSKQHFATPINANNGSRLIHYSLQFLGLSPPELNKTAPIKEQLEWGTEMWDIQAVPKLANIPQNSLEMD
ncbi:MAG: tRNA glutamyl-Q(34) synthetase GluQRS [Gammaproteobacteria bacterium]|nr:tRNA glutamyl-Q(34) synthetase GluQRS [Gammaproteobacteria bacterium]MDD9894957.1 tRNA glutamyl-Q(34) synthetase GluQRS [Gammaproteobacteria bacterium]MDD9960176.1 tRNA glutamyl-Q(34) synthetase GluQRS [Gammaproteobacteria bacterium]